MKTVILALVFAAAAYCQCGVNATLKPIGGGKQSCVPKSTLIGTDASGNVANGASCPGGATNAICAATQTQANNSTQVATTAYVDTGLATKAASNAATTVNGTTCTLGSTCTVTATPTAHATTHAAGGTDAVTLTEAQITSLTTDLAAKAPLASPSFTGTATANGSVLGPASARGTFLGSLGQASGVGRFLFYPNSPGSAPSACANAATADYWLSPTAGYVRRVTGNMAATNGNDVIRMSVLPDCLTSLSTDQNNGGIAVPPSAAAAGYASDGTWQGHVIQYGQIAFGIDRKGGYNSVATGLIGAEFVSDDGTADTILGTVGSTALTASSTQYLGFGGTSLNGSATAWPLPLPIAGTLKNFFVTNTASPTASATVTVEKNGSDSTLTITIGAGDTASGEYIDTTHTVSMVAGDTVELKTVSGATTQANIGAATLLFVPTDVSSAILWGNWAGNTATTSGVFGQAFSSGTQTTDALARYVSPFACTLSNLYVYQSVANGSSVVTTFTLEKNGSPAAITGTVNQASGTGSLLVDGTHSVSIAAGDTISLQAQTNTGSSGAMAGWAMKCN